MSDGTYEVVTVYRGEDRQSQTIDKIGGSSKIATQAIDGMKQAASLAANAFDAIASKVATTALAMGALAAAGAIGAVKVGLIDVNRNLEDTKIGFGTLFNALAGTGFQQGLALGQDLMEKIRADAKALPGEFGDFVGMAQTLAAPLLKAGKGVEDIRNLTRDTVVAAAALKMPFEQASREMAMLLEGRAGAHNILGTRLGIGTDTQVNGKAFNAASEAERIAFISQRLMSMKDALPAMAHSFSGLWSTMVDGLKGFAGRATQPLFERIKAQLERVNAALDSPRVMQAADRIGVALGNAFDYVVGRVEWIETHWSEIRSSAVRFGEELRDAFEAAWPIVQRIGGFLGEQLKDPGKALKNAFELRLGLGAAQMAPGMLKNGLGGLGGLGGGGGAGATAGAGAMEGGMGAAVAASGALAVALLAAAGAVDVLTREQQTSYDASLAADQFFRTERENRELGMIDQSRIANVDFFEWVGSYGKTMWQEIKENFGSATGELVGDLGMLWTAVHPLVDLMGVALLGAVDAAVYAFRILIAPLTALKWVIDEAAGKHDMAGGTQGGIDIGMLTKAAKQKGYSDSLPDFYVDPVSKDTKKSLIDAAGKAMGKGGVNVNVNAPMTIMSESDPERLAVRVAHDLGRKLRHAIQPLGLQTFGPEG